MRFVCISDTHGYHSSLCDLPEADGIIHAGDFSNMGRMEECVSALNWFNALPYKYRIIIAGNHDLFMDPDHADQPSTESHINAILPVSDGFHYLWNSACIINGLKFWGSPEQPAFFNWAFNLPRGEPMRQHWEKIPNDVDVLITHGPVYGILDKCPNFTDPRGEWVSVGCINLEQRLKQINPKVHVCGHIHASHGHAFSGERLHLNASICTEKYAPVNKPMLFDIDPVTKKVDFIHTF